MQTSDTVKLKKSELERWLHTKDGSEEAAFVFLRKLVRCHFQVSFQVWSFHRPNPLLSGNAWRPVEPHGNA